MIAVIALVGGIATGWLIIGGLIALGIGRAIRIADEHDQAERVQS